MHTIISRAQNVFGFATTVATFVAIFIAMSTVIFPQHPAATLNVRDVQVTHGRPNFYSRTLEDYAIIRFDLDVDISSLFNWNTKQVFVYVAAVFSSEYEANHTSQIIIWDAIIPSKLQPKHENQWFPPTVNSKSYITPVRVKPRGYSPGIFRLRNQAPKYFVTDISRKLSGLDNVKLIFGWSVQPWVGFILNTQRCDFLHWKGLKGGISDPFKFPPATKRPLSRYNLAKGTEANRIAGF